MSLKQKYTKLMIIILISLFLSACASFPPTTELEAISDDEGYRYANLDHSQKKEDLLVILTFSGGGTRAAALSYGVLEKLRESSVWVDGERRNLLDEVDVISSVSGGSFTAAYYGLKGEEIFEEGGRFQKYFLNENVEAILTRKLFYPYNWMRFMSPEFGRIEIADEVYQELLFGEKTFSDLRQSENSPFLMINATDMAKGAQFTFVQSQFDPICADLDSVFISRAVAASSNFPVAFTPLALNAYPGKCKYEEPEWVNQGLKDVQTNPRRYYSARSLKTYQESERQYVHLLDGGIADNIGLRAILASFFSGDSKFSILRKMGIGDIKKIVIIVVDAKNSILPKYDESARAPGTIEVVKTIATTPLDNYSFDTLELLKEVMRTRADAQKSAPDLHQIDLYSIYIGFDRIQDEKKRNRFFKIETTFSLESEQVNSLRTIGGKLLDQSECFKLLTAEPAIDPKKKSDEAVTCY